MKKVLLLFIPFLAIGCSETSTTNSPEEPQKEDSVVTEQVVEALSETELPAKNGFEIYTNPYEVESILAETESEYNKGLMLSLYLTVGNDLILNFGYVHSDESESWLIGVEVFNNTISADMEIHDFNKDEVKDEVAILWHQSDGNNGLNNGYESDQQGIVIIDLTNRNEMLNFIYSSNYSSYSAGENADVHAADYHAKMAEDSEWEICAYNHDLKIENNEIVLSNHQHQVEGLGECVLRNFATGIYAFDLSAEKFILKTE